ncbi:ATPase WRNIP1-like [Ornithodoros turicata]|uniref:ATPase WRNIP1-like n=1 Tax=Ornithodoros turicata TaxID=34597 RepID=UPI003139D68F
MCAADSALLSQLQASPSVPKPQTNAHFKPLAEVVRPTCLDEYVGQRDIVGENCLLRKLILSNNIPSMVLWGPPGCGKTTIASIIAKHCKQSSCANFVTLSAVSTGVKEVKDVIERAKNDQKMLKRKTVLFIDEIHRFNKLQQDVFLPHVENGTIILIGATTENPSFSLNSALLSRCRVFVLEKLSLESVTLILQRALKQLNIAIVPDGHNQLHEDKRCAQIDEDAVRFLAAVCDGDARTALNALQAAVQSHANSQPEKVDNALHITKDSIRDGLQKTHFLYDRKGDQHYNTISAFIKSMRGSDANAALYYLARMLTGGEDPRFIARRLIIFASEDIGIADSQALPLAVATHESVLKVGMPECRIMLSHCTTYMARAPKSRETYNAYGKVEKLLQDHEGPLPPIPLHLCNAPTSLMKQLGYGMKPTNASYLPASLTGVDFFGHQ